jgi:hypothetical protein
MMLNCLRRAPRLVVRAQRAAFATAATKRTPFEQWEIIYYRGLAACSVGGCAWLGLRTAKGYIKSDIERSDGASLHELVKAVTNCELEGNAFGSTHALFNVSCKFISHLILTMSVLVNGKLAEDSSLLCTKINVQVMMRQITMISDTTPAFVQAGLLSALRRVLDYKQASEYDTSLVLQIVHKVTHTSYGARAVLSDEALCHAAVQASVAEIAKWCDTATQPHTDAAVSEADAAKEKVNATSLVTQAVLILAQLLEEGISMCIQQCCSHYYN